MNKIYLGTPVEVKNIGDKEWHKRIFICSSDKGVICVGSNDEELFKQGFSFRTTLWDQIKVD